MNRKAKKEPGSGLDKSESPVAIPLPFEQAVEGLLGVKPARKKKAAQSEQKGKRPKPKKKK